MSGPPGSGEVAFAAISPHGGIAISKTGRDEDTAQAPGIQRALLELGRRLPASGAESVVLFTPHNVHVGGTFAVIDAGRMHGSLGQRRGVEISLKATVDRDLALGIQRAAQAKELPMVTVSYGGEGPSESDHPMDWGTLIPLWYLGGREESPLPITVVVPCRDQSAANHVRVGQAIADAIRESGKKVAVIASCDHGHGHQAAGPYGFHAESAVYDEQVQEILRGDRIDDLTGMARDFVDAAKADSWWQMLMLHGVLGDGWKPDLLVYECPTYFGMMVAHFTPRPIAIRAS